MKCKRFIAIPNAIDCNSDSKFVKRIEIVSLVFEKDDEEIKWHACRDGILCN